MKCFIVFLVFVAYSSAARVPTSYASGVNLAGPLLHPESADLAPNNGLAKNGLNKDRPVYVILHPSPPSKYGPEKIIDSLGKSRQKRVPQGLVPGSSSGPNLVGPSFGGVAFFAGSGGIND